MPKRKQSASEKNRSAKSMAVGRSSPAAAVQSTPLLIAGIGASAGGLEAVTRLIEQLPADTGMAFVLVQHLDPRQASLLPSLLARTSPIPVREVADNLHAEPNHLYVMPSNSQVTVSDGSLRLSPRTMTEGVHMPIDHFLRSLAEIHGSKTVGIVLSGTGSDGTLGLERIKHEGGLTFAQDPATAKFDGMPSSAIAAGVVDFVLPPEKIANELGRISRNPLLFEAAVQKAEEPAPQKTDYSAIFGLLRTASGVDFAQYKNTTVDRRIRRRMVLHKLSSLKDYEKLLRGNPAEAEALHDDMLINVTCFFREKGMSEALKQTVFPKITQNRPDGAPIRIWVPGCSSGQEAYSIAMGLVDFLGNPAVLPPIQIFATDLSEKMVRAGRAGIYPEGIASELSPTQLRRFFGKANGRYQINKALREMIIFARQDLTKDPPFSNLDLISCCNVLIYLEHSLQKKVFESFQYALKPDGFLILGKAETITAFPELFSVVDKKHRIYSRKPVRARFALESAGDQRSPLERGAASQRVETRVFDTRLELQREVDRTLVKKYAPTGVLVDDNLDIIQFRGDTEPYLRPRPGEASLNLLKMARDGVAVGLRSAIQKARKDKAPVRLEGLKTEYKDEEHKFNLEVLPVSTQSSDRHYLILFDEIKPPALRDSKAAKSRATRQAKLTSKDDVARLQLELASTRDYLQAIIEEQEATNEELKSASEEVQSSNEELQSANEELETAKEEQQSAYEELTTLNEQIENRNAELNQLSNDLASLLSGLQIPIVMLSNDLRIRRFTPLAETVLNIHAHDVGRSITDIKLGIDVPDLEGFLTGAVRALSTMERDVQHREGRWYSMIVHPSKTEGHKVDGTILMFMDITERKELDLVQKRYTEQLVSADHSKDEFLAMVSHELRTPLNALLGWAHVLAIGGADTSVVARASHAIERSVKSQARILEDLLDISRIVAGKLAIDLQPAMLIPIIEGALGAVQSDAAGKSLEIELKLDPSVGPVLGDTERLQQVVWNLLANSIRYTPSGGRITVELKRVGASAQILVSDTGLGIDAVFLPHVFERFRQSASVPGKTHGGLGLGLTIVDSIVALHGGSILAESQGLGHGSTFTVTLPLLDPATAARIVDQPQPSMASAEVRPELNGLWILAVDDEADARDLLATVLRQSGAQVTTASSSAEALAMLGSDRNPDLIVSDIGMAGQDGYDLIRQIRSMPPEQGGTIPAIALTAYASRQDRARTLEAGYQAHMAKPIRVEEFLVLVGKMTGRARR